MKLLLIWFLNALALLTVATVLPGITVDGYTAALVAALILGLINTLLRPLLILLTLPVTIVTYGFFILVINGLLFWFAGSVLKGFEVRSLWYGIAGALLYSIISSVLAMIFFDKNTSSKHQSP